MIRSTGRFIIAQPTAAVIRSNSAPVYDLCITVGRYEKDGEALLVLLPSEEPGMVRQLTDRKIPVNGIK